MAKTSTERVRAHRARRGQSVAKLADHIAKAAGLPEPPARDALLKALAVQAMEGNVPAIRLLLEEYRRDGDSNEEPKKSAIDELAKARAARAG